MIISLKLRRTLVIASCAALLSLGSLTTAATAVASTTPARADSHVTAQPGYERCSIGHFCIYEGFNGESTQCQWSDRAVRDTADQCSFIRRGAVVRSVYNRTEHRVQYYTQNGYNNRVGSTQPSNRGNLAGSYQIRSFQPQE